MSTRKLELDQYLVLCREDREPDGTKGKYVLVGKPHDRIEDAHHYSRTVSESRVPVVVRVVFKTGQQGD